jgi:hypothetical protein
VEAHDRDTIGDHGGKGVGESSGICTGIAHTDGRECAQPLPSASAIVTATPIAAMPGTRHASVARATLSAW